MAKLSKARFFTTAADIRGLPRLDVPEVAFAGRSNAGKSSAINCLCRQKKLAHASSTPGRTQQINFFSVGGSHPGQHRKDPTDTSKIELFLVDLPGYGFAKVPGAEKDRWQRLIGSYLMAGRPQLKALVLVMDARRPFQPLDLELLRWFAPSGLPVHCLLTKCDKLNRKESTEAIKMTEAVLRSYADENGQPLPFTAQLFSAVSQTGLDAAEQKILSLCGIGPEEKKAP